MPKVKIKVSRSFEEIIIISTSLMTFIAITPFAIYRYFNTQYGPAFTELLGVMIVCAMGAYVWNTRNTKYVTLAISIFMLFGLVGFNYLLGSSILFWIYPVIMLVYCLNPMKISAALATCAIIALLPLLLREKNTIELISIIITLLACQVFGCLHTRNKQLQHKKMESIAFKDGLTGALNRRAFEERIHFLHTFSSRNNISLESTASLIIFDVDNFKMINDSFGHTIGDQVLICLTRLFKDNIRDIDQLYRYGGEEFVVIANGSDVIQATELAEKLRQVLESTEICQFTKVTASFGVAELRRFEDPISWIERADKAMYRAKISGRNKVYIANFDSIDRSEDIIKYKLAHSQ